ncbi:MAG: type II CAAX endopeptidase family protein, partial [Anaerolineaceae bacterium]|nr:type II CAAX endopeptidase family protein [Anaerolineaceae bacterium]
MKLRTWIREHTVWAYFLLTIVWSYLFWALLFTLLPVDPAGGPSLLHVLLAGLGGSPSLMGLALTGVVYGRAGYGEVWARLRRGRVSLAWYAVALLGMPALTWAAYQGQAVLGGPAAGVDWSALGFALPAGVMACLLEEFGWRGFALPELQKRFSPLAAGLLVGGMRGLWHVPLNLTVMAQYGGLAAPLLLVSGPLLLTAASLLMTWVYNRTGGSLLLMVLMHSSITVSGIVFALADP